jgi:hypothetical protein
VLGIVAGDIVGDGLLLEPLAGVVKGNAGGGGDLGLGCGSKVVERLVEPELEAQADAERLERVVVPSTSRSASASRASRSVWAVSGSPGRA